MNHTMNTPTATQPPAGSRIAGRIAGADFHDAWSIDAADPSLSALGQFLKAVQTTPRWVETCMTLRNRAVQLVGLKNLGELSEINPAKPDADYQPGDRVGIFTLFENTPDEVLLGDRDKHLDVVLSVHCDRPAGPAGARDRHHRRAHTRTAWGGCTCCRSSRCTS